MQSDSIHFLKAVVRDLGNSVCNFLLQVLNVFSVTLSAKQKPCLSAICKSTWLHGCLNVMCATSSWRLLSNYWSTRNAILSPLVGSSKESKYTNFYCVKYLDHCGSRNRDTCMGEHRNVGGDKARELIMKNKLKML